ncbi:MAG: DUF1501 domain-containing protein [Cyanobacteria bacterium SZAS LIN-3]|nr:DUF1501 domain-containing protein [Cyanobacteria bacterium SZAS LIN-3]
MNRRDFLKIAAASSMVNLFGFHPGALAFNTGKPDGTSKKLIVILLRGGVDGLNVVAPYGDNRYSSLRPSIALSKSEKAPLLDLDGYFGLHPAMAPLISCWQNKTLAFVHDCGSPDPTRSHFDAQDYMESGVPGQKSVSTGWINRLVGQMPTKHTPLQAISVGPVLPRICSGPTTIATVSRAIAKNKSVMDRPMIASSFEDLYSGLNDDVGRAFAEGVAAHTAINEVMDSPDASMSGKNDEMSREQKVANAGAPTPKAYNKFGMQLSNLFRKDPTVQVAFADFGGWDTHIRQGAGQGQLAQHLAPLAQGLGDLVTGLGPLYKDTTILVMSEFGRTAKENGNGGTDHGHGNVMWLLGGDIPGGKVYGKWGGLASSALHEDRDLPASTDFRTVISAVLGEHMNVSKAGLNTIFPGFSYPGNPFVS